MGYKANPQFYILLLIALICNESKSTVLNKREVAPTNVDNLEKVLEEQIASFAEELFVSDPLLEQKVDRTNKLSTYNFIKEKETVYERNQDDSNKAIVVLTQEEDKIPFKKVKRSHVVLRKAANGKYSASFGLIRDATPLDPHPILINGKNQIIEWLFYDDHLIQGRSLALLSFTTCAATFLAPCQFNKSILTPPEKFISAPPYNPKIKNKHTSNELSSIPILTENGFDTDDNYDLYYDLEVASFQEGRGVLVGAIGYLTSGIGTTVGYLGEGVGYLGEGLGSALTTVVGRRKRENVDNNLANYPGWKTQYVFPTKGVMFRDANTIFYSFGNCPYIETKAEDLLRLNTPNEIIRFYLTVLRVDCIDAKTVSIAELIKDGILSVSLENKVFELDTKHKYLIQPKLNLHQLLSISRTIGLVTFSKAYAQEAKNPKANQDYKIGKRQISRSINFIVQVYLHYLQLVREVSRSHILYLTRNVFLNVNTMLVKLSQDAQNLERCEGCAQDLEINFNDRVFVMALNRFIIQGLGPVEAGADILKSFQAFYSMNEDKFEKFVYSHT